MTGRVLLVGLFFTFHLLQFLCNGQSCSSWDVRLYSGYSSTSEAEGTVQICLSGTWYSACDYYWHCADANVACQQLGLGKAKQALYNSVSSYGSWNYIYTVYFSCSGSESALLDCNKAGTSSTYCRTYYDQAGVKCTGNYNNTCSKKESIRLYGGKDDNEGVVEYCYLGIWSPFCSLDDEEATVACRQLGHHQYTWASIYTQGTFLASNNYSLVTASCSSTAAEYYLSNCTSPSSSDSSCATLCSSHPVGIRCYDPGECTSGAVRLADGVLEREGRVEVCINGVWGSICGDGWNTIDGYVLCKELGFDDSEPTVYTNSKFGDGYGPIVYSNVKCNGWEKGIAECPKNEYLQFTCSRSEVSGVLCHDDCTSGDVRLTGGEFDGEGTVEVCFDRLWGTIADSNWDDNDAAVICRQLGYSPNGEISAVVDSMYGNPNRTVHFKNVDCSGMEQTISECAKFSYSLEDGKAAIGTVEVAGVECGEYIPPMSPSCLPLADTSSLTPQCNESDLRLVGGKSPNEGRLEFCYQQQWSPFCNLVHIEASVACKQLGYTQYTWAAIITSGEFGTSQNYSLFDNITCSETASEYSLGSCTVNVGTCLTTCANSIGIRCFEYGTCSEGDSRIVDGFIAQEGRVEVCVNGVWGSVCSTGWSTDDANVVCRQLGFPGSKPIPYYDFGIGNGPIIFSNVACMGWENNLSECTKDSYMMFDCPPNEVAGVFCADYCFTGDIRLVGGSTEAEGTVEICFDSLWGLIDESGWGLNDAHVVCEQLGYGTTDAQPVFGSFYGKPNKTIHASGVFCVGDEEELIECSLTVHSLDDGRQQLDNAEVAGVSCLKPTNLISSLATGVFSSSTVICQTFPSPSAVMVVPTTDVDCDVVSTNYVTTTLNKTFYVPETFTSYSTTTSTLKTTVTLSPAPMISTVTAVSTATTELTINNTISMTVYSTLTSTEVSTATATVTSTNTTTEVSISTVTSTAVQPTSVIVYLTATESSNATITEISTTTSTEISTSTFTYTGTPTETFTLTYTETSTTTTTDTFATTTTDTSTLTAIETTTTTTTDTSTTTATDTSTLTTIETSTTDIVQTSIVNATETFTSTATETSTAIFTTTSTAVTTETTTDTATETTTDTATETSTAVATETSIVTATATSTATTTETSTALTTETAVVHATETSTIMTTETSTSTAIETSIAIATSTTTTIVTISQTPAQSSTGMEQVAGSTDFIMENSSALMIVVAILIFALIVVIAAVCIIFVVMKVRKKGKEQLVYSNQSSIAVDNPLTSPPKYCEAHAGAFEMEAEVLKEAEEDGKDIEEDGNDTKPENKQVLLTSQDNSFDDTEM